MARSAQGDESAFRELVERHHAAVCALARWKLRDALLAEEIAQEAFLRLFRSLRSFRFDSSLRTWLSRVTLNLCNDHLRRVQRRNAAGPMAHDEEEMRRRAHAADPGPEASLLAREAEARMREAIERLPAELREVVLLRYAGEMSYTEIAATLDTPLGTICTRLARAVKLLGADLRGKEAGDE